MKFEEYWKIWLSLGCRNRAKKAAERAYLAALKETTPEAILLRLEAIAPEWRARKLEHRPYSATWLRSESWADDDVECATDDPEPIAPLTTIVLGENEDLAAARQRARLEMRRRWELDAAKHEHGRGCQFGAVCRFVPEKKPII